MKFTIKTPPATLAIASLCPKPENDAELEWLFEEAETAVSYPFGESRS